jgi:hypothetical protein
VPDWVAELCAVLRTHHQGDNSVLTLLQPFRAQLADAAAFLAAVDAYLRDHPDLVDDWELYSVDKRTGSGPYLLAEPARWEVGFYDGGYLDVRHHPDRFTACADFIVREVTAVLTGSRTTP